MNEIINSGITYKINRREYYKTNMTFFMKIHGTKEGEK